MLVTCLSLGSMPGWYKDTNTAATVDISDLIESSQHPYEVGGISHFLDGEMSSDVSQWPWASDFVAAECLPGNWTCVAFPTLPEVLRFEETEAQRCLDELTSDL